MSMTINCLLADDNELQREEMQGYLGKVPGLQLVAACADPFAAREILLSQSVDLVFLDIEMPGLTGIELIRSIPNPPLFIFTTSYSEFAVESYAINAIDYLLKPFTFNRFSNAIEKAINLFEGGEYFIMRHHTKIDMKWVRGWNIYD